MIIRNISIRSKLILATSFLVLLLTALLLVYLDGSRQVIQHAELLSDRSVLNSRFLTLQNAYYSLSAEETPGDLSDLLQQVHALNEQLHLVAARRISSGSGQEEMNEQQLFSLLARLEENLRRNGGGDRIGNIQARTDMELLGTYLDAYNDTLSETDLRERKKRNRQLALAMAFGIFILASASIIFALNLRKSFGALNRYADLLSRGDLPSPLDSSRKDEFGGIFRGLNRHTRALRKKVEWIGSMANDEPGKLFRPEAGDTLGRALLSLSEYLTRNELQEITRNREDKKTNWISEGRAQLGEVLRSEREDVGELSFLIIKNLVTYMDMEMGSLYVTNDSEPQRMKLDLTASYAYDRRKFKTMSLEWGEGLPGTCALEKERIFITDVPPDYFEISSALGDAKPNCILLVPLKIGDRVAGVIELATVRLLRPFEMDFVDSMAERIASSLMAVRNSEKTARLLEQSQSQARTLIEQETVLRENLEKLEQAQQDSSKKESEISGILKAIKQSALVAELGLNGRFTSINEQFLMVLESGEEQVLGKLHSDFAVVDRTSEEYKAFWSTLKEGKSVSNTEQYRLYSGDEIWLQQTFTPIVNNEGRVQRILNIAVNITEERSLQEQIRSREQEIRRKGLDMETLDQAVNASLIKCELDADGIIMLVNDRYSEVTGYSRKELLGRNYRLFLKDEEKDQFEKIWEEVLKEKTWEGSIRRSLPTGEEVWLASTFSPVINETGVIYKVYFLGLDISEKRLKYQLLENANQEIERLKNRLADLE